MNKETAIPRARTDLSVKEMSGQRNTYRNFQSPSASWPGCQGIEHYCSSQAGHYISFRWRQVGVTSVHLPRSDADYRRLVALIQRLLAVQNASKLPSASVVINMVIIIDCRGSGPIKSVSVGPDIVRLNAQLANQSAAGAIRGQSVPMLIHLMGCAFSFIFLFYYVIIKSVLTGKFQN